MEVQLQEIIDKIRDEGIEVAQSKAAAIAEDAERKRREIVAAAKEEAERIVLDAQSERARMVQAGEAALQQAGRDLLLKLKGRIENLFRSVVEEAAVEAGTGAGLADTVAAVVAKWKPDAEIDVLVSEKEFAQLEKKLKSALSDRLKSGVELKTSPRVSSGFRVVERDGGAYVDFTDAGIAEALYELLGPRLSEILRTAIDESAAGDS